MVWGVNNNINVNNVIVIIIDTSVLLEPIKAECALVIVEHDLDFIRDICDVLTVLDQGRVLDTGTVDEIQRSPKVQQVYTTRV